MDLHNLQVVERESKNKTYSAEKVQEIIHLHQLGKSPKAIADLLGTYNTTIRRILIKNNIELKTREEAHRVVKHNPFINYETDEQAAYWLGYLIADGNVFKNTITICTVTDPDHLENYAKFVGIKVIKVKDTRHNSYSYIAAFSNREVVNWLIELGITPKKSLTFEFKGVFNIPLLVGVIDGDGYIRKDQNVINITTGSKKFADQLIAICNELNWRSSVSVDKRGNTTYGVNIWEKTHIVNYVNKNLTLFMKRKWAV